MEGSTRRVFRGHGGVKLIGDAAGPADAPATVVFLHGGGQTRHSWHGSGGRLAEHGFQSLVLDARGHGESDWAPDGDYGLDAFVGDLCAVLDELSRPVALVGASMGGLTALRAAGGVAAERVAALVLVDVVPRMDREGGERIGGFMRANPDGFASLEEAADVVAAYLPHRPRPKDPRGLLKNLRLVAGRYHWHWDPAFIGNRRFGEAINDLDAMETAARAVRAPTLLVRGGSSEIVSEEGAQAFLAVKPDAEYVDVKGAHHMVAGDRNDAFATAVEEFLHRVLPAAR